MATLNAIRYCEPLKMFCEKLRAKGNSFKVAIVAVMRKLITLLNIMVKTNTCWQEQKKQRKVLKNETFITKPRLTNTLSLMTPFGYISTLKQARNPAGCIDINPLGCRRTR